MADVIDALWDRLVAIKDAATATLSAASADTAVGSFVRSGDDEANPARPSVRVTMSSPGGAGGTRQLRVGMEVITDHAGTDRVDQVVADLVAAFDGVALGTGGGWAFSPLAIAGEGSDDLAAAMVGRGITFGGVAVPGSDAILSGTEGAITGLSNVHVFSWVLDRDLDVSVYTNLFGGGPVLVEADADRYMLRVSAVATGATPATGAKSVVLTRSSGDTLTGSVVFGSVRHVCSLGDGSQAVEMSGMLDGALWS